MRLLVISDSHGNLANLKHVMGFAKNLKMEAVVHSGDWNNIESVETVLSFGIPLYTVLGNADADPQVAKLLRQKSTKYANDFLKIELGGKNIGIVHKPSDVKKYFVKGVVDVIFCGHLHSKDESLINGIKVVRAGALENTINFTIYNTETGDLEFIKDE